MSDVELSKYLWRSTENAFELLKRRVDGTQELPSKQALYQLKVRGTRQIQNSIPYDDPCAYFDVQKLLDEALFGKHSYESDNTSIISSPRGTTDYQSEDASSDLSSDCSHATDDEFPSSTGPMTECTLNASGMTNMTNMTDMSVVAAPDAGVPRQQEVVADVIPHEKATASAEADVASVPVASVLSVISIDGRDDAIDVHSSLILSATDQVPLTTATGLESAAPGGEDTAQDPHVPATLLQDPSDHAAPANDDPSSSQQPPPLSSQPSQQEAQLLSSPQPVRVWGVYSQEEIDFIQRTREEYRLAGKKPSTCRIYIAQQLGRSERSVETRIRNLVRTEQRCQPLPILAPTAPATSPSPPSLLAPPAPLLLSAQAVQGSTASNQPSILPDGDDVSSMSARRAELPPPPGTVQAVPAGNPRTRHQLPEVIEEGIVPLSVLGNFSLEEVNYMLHAREVFGRAGRKHPSLVAFLSQQLGRVTRTIEYKLKALCANLRLPEYFVLYVRPVYHPPTLAQGRQQAQETAGAGQQRASDHRNIRSAVPPTPAISDAVTVELGGVKRTLSEMETETITVTEVTERAAPTFTAEEVNVIQIATDVHVRRGSSLDECLQFLVVRLSRPGDDILAQMRSMNCAAASAAWGTDPAWAAVEAPRPPLPVDSGTMMTAASIQPTAGVSKEQGSRRVVALPAKKRVIPATKWTYAQAPCADFGVGQRRNNAPWHPAVPFRGVAAEGQSANSEAADINPFALLNRIWQGECRERGSPHPEDAHPAEAHPPEAAVDNSAIPADCESAATCSAAM